MDVQESSGEDNAKLNFVGVILESKKSWRVYFQAFKEPKIQNFGKHCATSEIYYIYYGHITNLPFWATGRLERMIISWTVSPYLRAILEPLVSMIFLTFIWIRSYNKFTGRYFTEKIWVYIAPPVFPYKGEVGLPQNGLYGIQKSQ